MIIPRNELTLAGNQIYPNKLQGANGDQNIDDSHKIDLSVAQRLNNLIKNSDSITFDFLSKESNNSKIQIITMEDGEDTLPGVQTKCLKIQQAKGKGGLHKISVSNIQIKPHVYQSFDSVNIPEATLKEINLSLNEATEILTIWAKLCINPVKLFNLLQKVEQEFVKEVNARNINFTENDRPTYIITGGMILVPGPRKGGWDDLNKKGRIIDSVLLKLENKYGISSQGTQVYTEGITNETANYQIGERKILFKEENEFSHMLLHGKNSHRLLVQVLIAWLVDTDEGKKFEKLKPSNILKLLVNSKIKCEREERGSYRSAWNFLLDNLFDMNDGLNLEDPDLRQVNTLNFSCRSPFVFNSLLLCFGEQLGLPILSFCFLNSHYKAVKKMADRIIGEAKISQDTAYNTVVEKMSYSELGNIVKTYPFLSISFDKKYKDYPGVPNSSGIKIKKSCNISISPGNQRSHSIVALFSSETPCVLPGLIAKLRRVNNLCTIL